MITLKKVNPFDRPMMALYAVVGVSILILFLLPGCNTPPKRIATEAAGVQVVTVDAAMQAWADYVRAGHATQDQVDAVKDAYIAYYNASLSEKAVLLTVVGSKTNDSGLQIAVAAGSAAEAPLIALIVKFLPPKYLKLS